MMRMHATHRPPLRSLLQYFVGMKADPANLHDQILLPLNVAAHAGGVGKSEEPLRSAFSIANLMTSRASQRPSVALVNRSVDTGFWLVFVTSENPCDVFVKFASTMCDFIMNHATGIVAKTIRFSALPCVARRLTIYVFLLDSPESVDLFYRRVHCAPPVTRRSHAQDQPPRVVDAWPTSQILVTCQADVLKQKKPPPGTPAAPPPPNPIPVKYSVKSLQATKLSQTFAASSSSLSQHKPPSVVSTESVHLAERERSEHVARADVSGAPPLPEHSTLRHATRGVNDCRTDADSSPKPGRAGRLRSPAQRSKVKKITRLPGAALSRDPLPDSRLSSPAVLTRTGEDTQRLSARSSNPDRRAPVSSTQSHVPESLAKSPDKPRERTNMTRVESRPPSQAKSPDKRSAALRTRWRRAVLNVVQLLKRRRLHSVKAKPAVLDLPVLDSTGNLSQHLKTVRQSL